MTQRSSKFDLYAASEYLRHGFQSMSRDQEEAREAYRRIRAAAGDNKINLILGLAGLIAGRAAKVADEEEKQ